MTNELNRAHTHGMLTGRHDALVARLLQEAGVGPESPGLPPQAEAVTPRAPDGRGRRFLINHRTEPVPLPEPGHDLPTGGTVSELPGGGSAALRLVPTSTTR